jgi:SpoVK/Ycf46/Vps4 family AAA+-type ATPase
MQDCDAALLRRFERRIAIPLPSPQQRASFISTLLQRAGVQHDLSTEQLEQVAAATQQYSCSDLVAVCRQAALEPVRQLMAGRHAGRKRCRPAQLDPSAADSVGAAAGSAAELRPVNLADFSTAMQRVASTLSDAGCCKD